MKREQSATVDLLVLEWSSVHPDTGSEVSRLLTPDVAARIVVVYRFAADAALRKLETSRITAVRAPLSLAVMETLIDSQFILHPRPDPLGEPASAVPTRRFSDAELTHIAGQAPSVLCECPRHLTDLISSLNSFESYSAECESRNEEDAAVHAYLHAATARAREPARAGPGQGDRAGGTYHRAGGPGPRPERRLTTNSENTRAEALGVGDTQL